MTYYGDETNKASENFALGFRRVNIKLIHALVMVKKVAALSLAEVEGGDIFPAVVSACDDVLTGKHDDQFITDALQGGAGTSTHMNVCEVLSAVASEKIGKAVHPLDDVNRGQSTKDVYPTARRVASIKLLRALSEECAKLQEALQQSENRYGGIRKLARTELVPALATTMGDVFGAWAQAISRDRWRLYKIEERLRQVNLGGTMIGGGDGAKRQYRYLAIENLRELSGIGFAYAEYPADLTQNNDVFVEVSGLLKALAVNLMKIANDLRLQQMLGEIKLAPLQAGSTIMPGKVNPVIPEMVIQTALRVIADDTAVTNAAAHGELELNAFMPLIADSLLEMLELLINSVRLFREKCITLIAINEEACKRLLADSNALAFDFVEKLGYEKVAAMVKEFGNDPQLLQNKLIDLSKALNLEDNSQP
jgi:aspartate ammonia-lyase